MNTTIYYPSGTTYCASPDLRNATVRTVKIGLTRLSLTLPKGEKLDGDYYPSREINLSMSVEEAQYLADLLQVHVSRIKLGK